MFVLLNRFILMGVVIKTINYKIFIEIIRVLFLGFNVSTTTKFYISQKVLKHDKGRPHFGKVRTRISL